MRAREPLQREVFRPYRLLGLAMAFAGLLWSGVFVYLFTFDWVPWRTWASVVFFMTFFAVATRYYWRAAIVVDGQSLTYRGFLVTRCFGVNDIRKLDVVPGIITVYAIRLADRAVHFTSLFARHRVLAELLVQRAGLSSSPLGGAG